jgi:Na+-driven multidrug efflux pump
MSAMLRNIGYAKEAAFGLGMGGVLNVLLDPLFMFVLLPDGYEVVGAATATMLSNMTAFAYYMITYIRVQNKTILAVPRKIEKVSRTSWKAIFAVGVPASLSVFLYDLTNIVINKLSSSHGDLELAAIGIVLKVERLPTNIGIGICMGMMPLIAYNYAAKNEKRMKAFFNAARIAGIAVGALCVVLYFTNAPLIMKAFISDPATVKLGTSFLKARCFAPPFMFLSFNMVNFMQAIGKGKISLYLCVIRQLCLNIPILFTLNFIFGMSGIIWTQAFADCINVVISYIIYFRVMRKIK